MTGRVGRWRDGAAHLQVSSAVPGARGDDPRPRCPSHQLVLRTVPAQGGEARGGHRRVQGPRRQVWPLCCGRGGGVCEGRQLHLRALIRCFVPSDERCRWAVLRLWWRSTAYKPSWICAVSSYIYHATRPRVRGPVKPQAVPRRRVGWSAAVQYLWRWGWADSRGDGFMGTWSLEELARPEHAAELSCSCVMALLCLCVLSFEMESAARVHACRPRLLVGVFGDGGCTVCSFAEIYSLEIELGICHELADNCVTRLVVRTKLKGDRPQSRCHRHDC